MSESELPTMFTVKRDEHYCEPFGENWDAVLSRLTENQINFVGNEYGHLRHQINENYAELTSLRAELERVKAENEWIPVSVRLPREDEVVIVVNEQMTVFPSWYHGTFFYQQAEDLSPVSFPVTHWKPLPAAPEEGE